VRRRDEERGGERRREDERGGERRRGSRVRAWAPVSVIVPGEQPYWVVPASPAGDERRGCCFEDFTGLLRRRASRAL
jgi:hypothetical protein